MSKKYVVSILAVVYFIFGAFSAGHCSLLSKSLIPFKTIIVDGDPTDWGNIQAFKTDPEDSACLVGSTIESGTDIKSVYLAIDNEYLYWRLDTHSGNFACDGPGMGKGPIFNLSDQSIPNFTSVITWGTLGCGSSEFFAKRVPKDAWYDYEQYDPSQQWGAIGAVAEGKIPLSLINEYEISGFMGIYYSGDGQYPCDTIFSDPLDNSGSTPYQISWVGLEHRIYEDGKEINKIMFQMRDDTGQPVFENSVIEAWLTDPDGIDIPIVDLSQSEPYQWGSGIKFNPTDSVWTYNLNTNLFSEHSGSIKKMQTGTYTLHVKDINNTEHTKDIEINRVVNLPIIPKKSIKSKYDKDGNLIITWDVPFGLYALDPAMASKVDIRLSFFEEDKGKNWKKGKKGKKGYDKKKWVGVYSCKLPSYVNSLFIPKDIVEGLMTKGDHFEIEALVRTNNYDNKSTSKGAKLKLKIK